MSIHFTPRSPRPRRALLSSAGKLAPAILAATVLVVAVVRSDEPSAESVGAIEGSDIAVKGPVSIDIANGRSRTVVSNGSEVTVKSGPARLDLVEGGVIGVCGPAHFTLLKAAGTLTIALDYGLVHAKLDKKPTLTVFTPLVQASLVDIGGDVRDATIGLETSGAMCVHTNSGAARLEQQLTGQSVLVPQGGEVSLNGGQLDATISPTSACGCEIAIAKNDLPIPTRSTGLSALAPPTVFRPNPLAPQSAYVPEKKSESKSAERRNAESKNAESKMEASNGGGQVFAGNDTGKRNGPPAVELPVYKVLMPPLTFDAKSPAPSPDPSPDTILLVRTVRLRPTVVFRGRVEPAAIEVNMQPAAKTASRPDRTLPAKKEIAKPPQPASVAKKAPTGNSEAKPTIIAKVRNFFRRLIEK